MRLDRFRLTKRHKKTPLLQLADRTSKRLQISKKSTGSRKHAVHQPAHDPDPLVASRGQVFKGHFINSMTLLGTPRAIDFCFVLNDLWFPSAAAGG
jgi:hypothetical protein